MKNVKMHRYATRGGARLHDEPGGSFVTGIPARSWLGVTDEQDGWYRVITARHDGWVRIDETSEAPHLTLRAVVSQKMSDLVQNYALL